MNLYFFEKSFNNSLYWHILFCVEQIQHFLLQKYPIFLNALAWMHWKLKMFPRVLHSVETSSCRVSFQLNKLPGI